MVGHQVTSALPRMIFILSAVAATNPHPWRFHVLHGFPPSFSVRRSLNLGIRILQGAFACHRPNNPVKFARATIALAFYPGNQGGFSTARLLSNRGDKPLLSPLADHHV
jgi:hypothetical protein